MGRRAHLLLDQPLPPHRPRLRTTSPTPRRDGPIGHCHHHDPTTRPTPHHLKPLCTSVLVGVDGVGLVRQRAYLSDLADEQWEIIEPMFPWSRGPDVCR